MEFVVHQENATAFIETNVDKLNAANASHLKAQLVDINKNSVNNIVIDMAKTNYCDSSGLSAILVANRICKDTNGKFALCNLKPAVLKMIQIAQLDKVFTIKDSRQEAEEFVS